MTANVDGESYRFISDKRFKVSQLMAPHSVSIFEGCETKLLDGVEANPEPIARPENDTAAKQSDSDVYRMDSEVSESPGEYWGSFLAGYQSVSFPSQAISSSHTLPDRLVQYRFPHVENQHQGIEQSVITQTAFAFVIGHMASSYDVVFGIPVSHSNELVESSLATVPMRVKWNRAQKVSELLQEIQQRRQSMVLFEHMGLHYISQTCSGAGEACTFQTLVVTRLGKAPSSICDASKRKPQLHQNGYYEGYSLVIEFDWEVDSLTVTLRFDSNIYEHWLMEKLLKQLDFVMRQIATRQPERSIMDIKIMTPQDLNQVWDWNSNLPTPVERQVAEVVEERAQSQPDAPAICAWDGELTYGELARLSTTLAVHLVELGVGPEVFVPLCFEKSMWTTVSILGVLKAGGAFILLDPSLPEKRLSFVVQELRADLLLCSPTNHDLGTKLVKTVLVLNYQLLDDLGDLREQDSVLYRAYPSSAAYAIFTSGSTGTPKGVIVSNSNVTSSFRQTDRLGIQRDSRVYDFASYSFTMSVVIHLHTLGVGACLCVPSDQDRKANLAGSLTGLRANVIWLTPSISCSLSPESVPTLRVIGLGGETVRMKDVVPWWGHVEVRNGYASSETVLSTLNHNPSNLAEACQVGIGAGLATWIVDPDDHNKLMPIGCTGELLLEGPNLSRGYINDPEKTAAAFVKDPVWMTLGSSSHPGRRATMYKTGDLVQYSSEGSIIFIGRKDGQVKINGQRVELGEIEFRLQACLPPSTHVAAEVIVPRAQNADPVLAAFISAKDNEVKLSDGRPDFIATARPIPVPRDLGNLLAQHLPSYMIPSILILLPQIPLTVTGKINRKELKEIGGSFSVEQLAEARTGKAKLKRQPSTDLEQRLQKVWADVLNLGTDKIGLDDNFFDLGGNSIAAIKATVQARKIGLRLELPDLFRSAPLVEVAGRVQSIDNSTEHVEPFSLLKSNLDIPSFLYDIATEYQLESSTIRDAYPCTPLQEAILSITSQRPEKYVMQNILKLSVNIDIQAFTKAWEQFVQLIGILRTRILQHRLVGLLQVVVDEPLRWIEANSLDDYLQSDSERPMGLGQELSRYALVLDDGGKPTHFVLTIHHCLFDGWSMPRMITAVNAIYHGNIPDLGPQFQIFIKYIKDQDDEAISNYWKNALADCQATPFPSLPASIQQPLPDEILEYTFEHPQGSTKGVTIASLIRAAWALVIGRSTNTTDVVFGGIQSGRGVPVADIDALLAPTIATVPIRIQISNEYTILKYLKEVHQQASDMMSFEQPGLQKILKMSPSCKQACMFQSLLLIQPEEVGRLNEELGEWYHTNELEWSNSYALMLEVQLGGNGITLKASFDSRVIESWLVQRLMERLEYVMTQLDRLPVEQSIQTITGLTPSDLCQIWEWNKSLPEANNRCVHEMVQERVKAQPSSKAVCAWDGEFSYQELDELSTALSYQLTSLGVSSEIIPLCFEKSKWTPVAMLGVLKAGAAFVPLDTSLPEKRLRTIVDQVEAKVVLSSTSKLNLGSRLSKRVIEVSAVSLNLVQGFKDRNTHRISSSSPMYAVFTSGSTGAPKGIILSHVHFASAFMHQAKFLGYSTDSRVFDFSSYAFDIAIHNTFATLIMGGCICIPSEKDRKDNVGDALALMRATIVNITPSVARLLDPSKLPNLKTLILCGEAVSVNDTERWWSRVQVINAYGPSECTSMSTFNYNASNPREAVRIGKGMGQVTWIVDPANHHALVPPGSIGELLLEGPIVGPGYLKDDAKTAEVYIKDPTWLLQGGPNQPGRGGRIYKTGDLVRYHQDGSLSFVDRNDAQVKISGQRVELGEVEHWIRKLVPHAISVAAEVIKMREVDSRPTLVAFLQIENTRLIANCPGSIEVLPIPVEVEHRLLEHLPNYMVPVVFFSIAELPMGPTGKTDRKRLREIGGSFSTQELHIQTAEKCEKRMPTSHIGKKIQKIWGHVLDMKPDMIGLDDTFLKLGGDSIAAMQVSSMTHSATFFLHASDILRHRTISNLEKFILESNQDGIRDNSLQSMGPLVNNQLYSLTSVQSLYFHLQPDPLRGLNQHLYLKLNKKICVESLSTALSSIVRRHDALRARYIRTQSGSWVRRITDNVSSSFSLHVEEFENCNMNNSIMRCRKSLDVENGPTLASVFSHSSDSQNLLLSIPFIISESFPLKAIVQELFFLLRDDTATKLPLAESPDIQYPERFIYQPTSELVDSEVQHSQLSYWGIKNETNLSSDIIANKFSVDGKTTSILLGSGNNTFRTHPIELMISALIHSFGTVFLDRQAPEVVARDDYYSSEDKTFTSKRYTFKAMDPVNASQDEQRDLKNIIRETKDTIRTRSQSDLAADSTAGRTFPMEVFINYEGCYEWLDNTNGIFEDISIPQERQSLSSLNMRRLCLFELSIRLVNGCMAIIWEFSKHMRFQERILKWMRNYQMSLKTMATELSRMTPEWTLSDFPLAFSSYSDIKEFGSSLVQLEVQHDDIEDIFPCSPMQQGILLAQAKNPKIYHVSWEVDIRPGDGECLLDSNKLENAWKTVVRRHGLLRTVFLNNAPGRNQFIQIILKDCEPSVSWPEVERDCLKAVQCKPQLNHHFQICEFDGKHARIRFNFNHAITDGFSRTILYRDLQAAYDEQDILVGQYKNFVTHLQGHSHDEGVKFWTNHLADVEPCHFMIPGHSEDDCYTTSIIKVPSLDGQMIHSFCSKWDVTVATVIQTAWALVLATYTGTVLPCFGNLCSGRDLPIHNIGNIFGPLIGMVPCRVSLEKATNVIDKLKEVQNDALNSLPHQHFPLSEIHRLLQLGSRALFNTAMFFQIEPKRGNGQTGLVFEPINNSTETEYDVSIYAADNDMEVDIYLQIRVGPDSSKELNRLAGCFSVAISEILANPFKDICELNLVPAIDKHQIWDWNRIVPQPTLQCVHEMFEKQALIQPDSPAICSWDGDMTYKTLNDLSTKFAIELCKLGVCTDMLVPLCFEKSMWTTVAMLSILKAGGAFVLLDPSLPEQRLQTIVRQLNSGLIVSSLSMKPLSSRLREKVVTIHADFFKEINNMSKNSLHNYNLSSIMCVVFTSGSSGTPKGSIISHENFGTAMHYDQRKVLGLTSQSRVFQFSAYSFDVSISDTFLTMAAGGCLCVPSDSDRKYNLASSIVSLKANTAELTPSVARLLSPDQVPDLQLLIFAGEAVHIEDISPWWGKVRFINLYGPSECTPYSTINHNAQDITHATNIGKGVGQVPWVADPRNSDVLVPIGCIGELLLEGPGVSQGYLNEPEKTAAAFIENPKWLTQGFLNHPGRCGRLYKTGDLVRYNEDGSLVYIGRSDAQVKIRGQRVELKEIKYRIHQCLPDAKQVAVEVIDLDGVNAGPTLVAFLQMHEGVLGVMEKYPVLLPISLELQVQLSKHLPSYMVPTASILLDEMPLTSAGKINRLQLRETGKSTLSGASDQRTGGYEDSGRKIITETEQPAYMLAEKIFSMCSSWNRVGLVQKRKEDGCLGVSYQDALLFSCGLDSINIMSLMHFIRNEFKTQVPMKILMDKTTSIRSLADSVSDSQHGTSPSGKLVKHGLTQSLDLASEISRYDSIIAAAQRDEFGLHNARRDEDLGFKDQEQVTVLLTGASGYLGSEILRQLLDDHRVELVIAIVRGDSTEAAKKRTVDAARKALWWTDLHQEKLQVWKGDLSLPKFGLDQVQWKSLADGKTADVFIHNGAVVHWVKTYDVLENVNVRATVELLRLSITAQRTRFIFITGGRYNVSTDDREDEVVKQLSTPHALGYSQSKFVAQAVVQRAASRNSSTLGSIAVVSPGGVIGTPSEGVANADDYIWRLTAACVKAGVYCANMANQWVFVSDLGVVAKTTIDAALNLSSEPQVLMHIKDGMLWREFWEVIQDMGYTLEARGWTDWMATIRRDMDSERELHPLWPISHMFDHAEVPTLSHHGPTYYSTKKQLQRLKEAVRKNVAFLGTVGFLPLPPGAATHRVDAGNKGAFVRSGH